MRPSFITRMRWQVARSSGRSSEMTRTPSPRPARSRMMPWISAFEPTSTPTVGPFSTSTRGPARQPAREHHPLLVAAGERAHRGGRVGRLDREAPQPVLRLAPEPGAGRGAGPSRAPPSGRSRRCAGSTGSGRGPRSAGPRARSRCPPPRRRAGRRAGPARPSSVTLPASGVTRPKSALASAVRPEPSRPETPSTSPRVQVEADVVEGAGLREPAHLEQPGRGLGERAPAGSPPRRGRSCGG